MLRSLLASTFRLTTSRIDWWFVARSSLGVAIALIGGLRWGSTLDGLAAGLGAISTGFAGLQGVYRTRAAVMLGTAGAMALSAYVAIAAGRSTLAIVAVTVVFVYVYGIASSLGDAAAGIGLNASIALVILGNIGVAPGQDWIVAGWVLGGGLIQALLVIALWPVGGHAAERRALCDAYRGLARFAGTIGAQPAQLPAHDPLLAVRAALSDPQPFGRTATLTALQTLADEAERIRASLASLSLNPGDARELPQLTAALLGEIAAALDAARAPDAPDEWRKAALLLDGRPAWQRLYGQLRAAWRSAALPASPSKGRTALIDASLRPHVERWWPPVAASLTLRTPFGRHAIRLAVAVGACLLLYRIADLPRGYWAALTALLVLQPDFTTTFTRGLARIGGTLAGGALASGLALALPRTTATDLALAIAFAALGYLAFGVNYALYTVTITGYVAVMFSLAGASEYAAIEQRIAATAIGGAIALIAYAVWPSWETPLTRARLADVIDEVRQYASVVLAAYAGAALDKSRLRELQYAVWTHRSQVERSIERTLSEPQRSYEIAPADALAILESSRRLGLANIAAEAGLQSFDESVQPAVRAFSASLDRALQAIAGALRRGGAPEGYPDLRAEYVALAAALRDCADADRVRRFLADGDLYVDASNTIAERLH